MTSSADNQFLSSPDRLRPPRTLADYVAIAVCPVLIMVLVGSFVFFLLEIGYAGSHLGKLHWILFWFVLAMVLVSRIAIERGSDHAGVYGFGLAAATAFVLTLYVNNYLGAWCILGLIWWAANKLTWDCTVIDEDLDASGEGLLQAAKLDTPQIPVQSGLAEGAPAADSKSAQKLRAKARKPSWWKLLYQNRKKDSQQPHAPGLWVVYVSLVALPVFGLGQGLIPPQDTTAQLRAFVFLILYLAAALGLLMNTSFLGLRRYLRQRHLAMPTRITVSWMSQGTSLGLAVLLVCILLPRPNTTWSFGDILQRFGDPQSNEEKKSAISQGAENSSRTSRAIQPDSRSGLAKQESVQGDIESKGGENSPKSQGETLAPNAQQGGGGGRTRSASEPPPASGAAPTPSPIPRSSHLGWLKVMAYALIAIVVLLICLKNRQYLALLLRTCWEAIGRFWRSLFPSRDKPAASYASIPAKVAVLPFASFSNPFSSGKAAEMPVRDLVVYTFNALEAWAAGYGLGRDPEQTPSEFANGLLEQAPDLAFEVEQLARLYVQVAYGTATELPACGRVLEVLWSKMALETPPQPQPEVV